MTEGFRFEDWYRVHLEELIPWEGLRRGNRTVEALARAVFFKEEGEVVDCLVFEFRPQDDAPRRWFDSATGRYRSMDELDTVLRKRIVEFLEGG